MAVTRTVVEEPAVDDHRPAGRRARAPALALVLAGLGLALAVGSVVLATANGVSVVRLVADHDAVGIVSGIAAALLGLLIVSQHRGNRLGWLMLWVAASVGVYDFSRQYALAAAPAGPGWEVVNWLALWTNVPPVVLGTGLWFVIFPDGHPPSRRWRPLVWTAVAATVALSAYQAASAWPLRGDAQVVRTGDEHLGNVFGIAFLVAMLLFVLGVASLIARYRQAGAVGRQQIKWVMWSQIVAVPLQVPAVFGLIGAILELLTVPITFGALAIAIFRHRLYDIDRLFSRTLVYGLLSAFVVAGYGLGVLVIGNAFSPGARPNSLVVAGTTLAVAALFQPLRRRLQDAVDRRFNRRRYDAARTIDAFATRLRHHTDLDTLAAEVLAVVDRTMQPTQATLWLARRRQSEGAADGPVIAARASSL
jgi:hypothetical protein